MQVASFQAGSVQGQQTRSRPRLRERVVRAKRETGWRTPARSTPAGPLWIKFNNQPAPPKVGITARESGTYNDFTNINIGGVDRYGNSGVNDLSYMILEIQEELHELQPGLSIHIAENTPDEFLHAGIKVIRLGHGYPSVFNPDTYVKELVRQGKAWRTPAREAAPAASRWAPSARRRTC